MSSDKTNTLGSRLEYKFACWQGYCPSLAERENSKIRELASRLNATSDKIVLTNLLEWQNRTLSYWVERDILSLIIEIAIISLFITSPYRILPLYSGVLP